MANRDFSIFALKSYFHFLIIWVSPVFPYKKLEKNVKIWLLQTLTPLFTMKGASDDDAILSSFFAITYFISVQKISPVWSPLHTLLTFHLNFSIILLVKKCPKKFDTIFGSFWSQINNFLLWRLKRARKKSSPYWPP